MKLIERVKNKINAPKREPARPWLFGGPRPIKHIAYDLSKRQRERGWANRHDSKSWWDRSKY
jgi:hypothetical protein